MINLNLVQTDGFSETEKIEIHKTLLFFSILKKDVGTKSLANYILMSGMPSNYWRVSLSQIIGLPLINLGQYPEDRDFLNEIHSMLSV